MRRRGPLTWKQDRVGDYEPGGCADLFVEQIRLGYLLQREDLVTDLSADDLAALLRRSPRRILPDGDVQPWDRDEHAAGERGSGELSPPPLSSPQDREQP